MNYLDFESEYKAVRTGFPGGGVEAANAKAFANLGAQLRANTTRNRIRKVWFGTSNGLAYWLNSTVSLRDLDDVIFLFDTGAEFSGTPGAGAGIYFGWSGSQQGVMFNVGATGSTIQRGLMWDGSWTFATAKNNYGTAMVIDGVNNWGGPNSVLSFTSQGGQKHLKRGIFVDRALNGDNAHGLIGAIYSGGVSEGAIYAQGGGFAVVGGNISTSANQTGVFIAANASEMKLLQGLKVDGGGIVGIDCRGSDSDFLGQIEGFAGATMLKITRTKDDGNGGRYNRIGCNFNGRGTSTIPWIVEDKSPGQGMWGNKLDLPSYVNTADMSKARDSVILPSGVRVFGSGMDDYRLIVGGVYR
jgi:hypothetical protein